MSITKKLQSLNLDPSAVATLTYSEGVDVFVHNETEVETAIEETDVVSILAELVATPGLTNVTTRWGDTPILQTLREEDLLDDYTHDGNFAAYITDMLTENFYDIELIDTTTERYDHKRGFTTLTAEVQVPVSEIIEVEPFLSGWEISVETDLGTLTIEV